MYPITFSKHLLSTVYVLIFKIFLLQDSQNIFLTFIFVTPTSNYNAIFTPLTTIQMLKYKQCL